jgi:hypothetical protein
VAPEELARVGAWLKDQSDCPECGAKGQMWTSHCCQGCGVRLHPATAVMLELGKIWLRVQKKRRG